MLSALQEVLVAALRTADPCASLRDAAERDQRLDAAERAQLRAASDDGLRLTRVLVRKLRLQRLLAGDAEAARACREQPAAFARRFAAYDAAVPPTAPFPSDEAAAWRGFVD